MRSSFNRPCAVLFAALFALPIACSGTRGGASEINADLTPQEMQKKMAELGTPGEGHRRLEPLVGRFRASGTCWMSPDQPPTTMDGTANTSWTLGGHFLKEEFDGTFMGQPFQGVSYLGYNNATHRYEMSWVDSASTMLMPITTGTVDSSGKVFTFTGTFDCPIRGKVSSRTVLTIVDSNRQIFEMYDTVPGKKEALSMKIEYTRI